MCQSDRIHDGSRKTFNYFQSNMRILCKANVSRRCAFRVQCLRQRTLLISITYTMAQSTRTCVSSADIVIEETRRMSENISLPVEKYKAVLCATGGTWNYVWMGMQDRLFFGNHAGESCRKPCSTVYKILKVYHWIYKSDKKCDIVLDWLNIFFCSLIKKRSFQLI